MLLIVATVGLAVLPVLFISQRFLPLTTCVVLTAYVLYYYALWSLARPEPLATGARYGARLRITLRCCTVVSFLLLLFPAVYRTVAIGRVMPDRLMPANSAPICTMPMKIASVYESDSILRPNS